MSNATLSRRPIRRFWGWGNDDAVLSAHEKSTLGTMLQALGTAYTEHPVPQLAEFVLPTPRVSPPAALVSQFSASPLDRLNHAGGKSYADCAHVAAPGTTGAGLGGLPRK